QQLRHSAISGRDIWKTISGFSELGFGSGSKLGQKLVASGIVKQLLIFVASRFHGLIAARKIGFVVVVVGIRAGRAESIFNSFGFIDAKAIKGGLRSSLRAPLGVQLFLCFVERLLQLGDLLLLVDVFLAEDEDRRHISRSWEDTIVYEIAV